MTTFRATTHASRWGQLKSRVAKWQRRVHSRHELEALSDATLRDIGITRCRAYHEIKLCWMA
jgi:uncharacterized protein YjiS (DUF1127 family)